MQLATRWQRLLAWLADVLIIAFPYGVGALESAPMPLRVLCVAALLALLIIQIAMVSRHGQTIGKLILRIRIVRKDTLQNGGFVVNVLKRGLLNGLLSLVPGYFLVDSLFIFREDHRCVHDMIAGTCVIQDDAPVVQ